MISGPRLLGPEAFPFAPHISLGDIFFEFRGESRQLEVDAKRAGERAGTTAGRSFGSRMKSMLTAANIGTTVGAALGTVGIAALKMGEDYDRALDTIRIGTGATGKALAGLEADFKAVASRVPDDLEAVATVIADLNTRTGQTGEGLQDLAEQMLDLSRLTKTDAATNVANITRLFGDWSIATEDQAETLDQLFRASQATGIGVDRLSEQVVQFGAPLRNIGFEFEDAIALLAKWEKEGVNTTLSLGGLKIALGEFAKEGVDAKEGLADLVDQIIDAETAAEAMAIGVRKFGSRAGPDMVAAIREGRFATEGLVEVIENGGDTIAEATQDTEGLGEAWRQFKNIVATTVGPITKDFAGIASELGNLVFLLPALGGLVGRGLGAAWTKAGGGPAVRAAIAAVGAAAGVIYQGAAFAASTFGSALAGAWAAMGRPGSRVIVAAASSGRLAGLAFGAAAAAAVLTIPLVVSSDSAPDTAPHQLKDIERALKSLEGLDPAEKRGTGTVADLRASLEARKAALLAGDVELADHIRDNGAPPMRDAGVAVGAAYGDGVAEGASDADLPTLTDPRPPARFGERLTTAFVELGDTLATTFGVAVQVAQAELAALVDAIDMVAGRGIKHLRSHEKDADRAWKNIIGAGDRNKERLRTVREDIDKWERRLKRAIRNNDSEAAAFAQAQLVRLEQERVARRRVVNWAKEQKEALEGLPKETATTVTLDFQKTGAARLATAVFTELGKVRTLLGGRADGGPVGREPVIVGERGPEIFMPNRSGQVISNEAIRSAVGGGAGGDTHFHAEVHGLPMQARTPFEVVQQQRRAARFGTAIARPLTGFST